MKVYIVNQEPLEVTSDQARKLVESIASGTEVVVIGDEMVKSSAVMGVRNDAGEIVPKIAWGQLPEGRMRHFYDERRETLGEGYAKFKAMKERLLSR